MRDPIKRASTTTPSCQGRDELILRRSDTGHFILLDPRSQTTVVDEELARAHARMSELLASERPTAPAPSSSFEFRGRTQIGAFIVFVALPLLFLLAIERRLARIERSEALPPAPPTINSGAPPPSSEPKTGGGAKRSPRPAAAKRRLAEQTRESAATEQEPPASSTESDHGDEDAAETSSTERSGEGEERSGEGEDKASSAASR